MKTLTRNYLAALATDEPLQSNTSTGLFHTWNNQTYDTVRVNYDDFIYSNPVLQTFLNLSACLTWIIDIRTMQYIFISSNVEQILGYEAHHFLSKGLSFISKIIHPDDLPKTIKLINLIGDFLLALPTSQRQKYKFNTDYRIIKPDGNHIRILEQSTILQLDRKGNITHLLGVGSDITNWKKTDDIIASVSCSDNSTCFYCSPENDNLKSQTVLSKRERQIVKLMAEGYNSKFIADKLFISFHTVNTHRQNIIEKTHTKNTSGLIQFAICHGLI